MIAIYRRNLSVLSSFIILLNYLESGKCASYIAFVKDANLKPKCPLGGQETFQKPFVLLRLGQTPLNEPAQEISQEVDDFANEDNSPVLAGNGYKLYTLIKLRKSQMQELIDSGNFKLVESKDATPSNSELNNEDTDDWLEEDVRSKRRPWRKIQRIIRRQLIKKPKRYFKKIMHTFG